MLQQIICLHLPAEYSGKGLDPTILSAIKRISGRLRVCCHGCILGSIITCFILDMDRKNPNIILNMKSV